MKVVLCSIVRDVSNQLIKNIPKINKLMSNFKSSEIVIFENDSIDNTKDILKEWAQSNKTVTFLSDDYKTVTIPSSIQTSVNPYFSRHRISKMCMYRNKYLEYLENKKYDTDIVIIMDLDIPEVNVEVILNSINIKKQNWDCIASNSFFYDKNLQKIYYDSYALVPLGCENNAQTEESIRENQLAFSKIRRNTPLFPVYSAFGGIAIYKSEALSNSRYICTTNEDPRVEVKCEHFGLHSQIHSKGYNNFFINPNLRFPYKKIFDIKNALLFIRKQQF